MKKICYSILFFSFIFSVTAQDVLTPEALVQLNKVSGQGITKDGKFVIYGVSKYDLSSDSKSRISYKIPIEFQLASYCFPIGFLSILGFILDFIDCP